MCAVGTLFPGTERNSQQPVWVVFVELLLRAGSPCPSRLALSSEAAARIYEGIRERQSRRLLVRSWLGAEVLYIPP